MGYVFASKENPLHFIFFNKNDDCKIYMVSGIYDNTVLVMKLFKFNDLHCKPMSFKTLNGKLPRICMRIRPVYNKNEIQI